MVIEDTGIQVDPGGDLCTLPRSVPGAAGAPEDGARGTLFSGTLHVLQLVDQGQGSLIRRQMRQSMLC